MAELKTKPNKRSVAKFLQSIPDEKQRRDCLTLAEWMEQVTGAGPTMWGSGIVGFGEYHYHYASGREGDWFRIGFAPRKQNLTLYLMGGLDHHRELLAKLGKHKTGGGCLYIQSLDNIHKPTLKQIIRRTVTQMRKLAG